MPKDWNKRVSELEEQVAITKEKAKLQAMIAKKQAASGGKKKTGPKKIAAKPKTTPAKKSPKAKAAPNVFLLMPGGGPPVKFTGAIPPALLPMLEAPPKPKKAPKASQPKVIEPP